MGMETKTITLKEATEAVKGMFDVSAYGNRQEGKSYFVENSDGTTFCFDKRQYWRDEVIGKLSEYFNGKHIEGGQCRIDGTTLLWTTVHLEKLPEEKEEKTPVPLATMERSTRWEPITLGKARTLEELGRYRLGAYILWCERQGYNDLFFTSPKMSYEEWVVEYLEPWRKPSKDD